MRIAFRDAGGVAEVRTEHIDFCMGVAQFDDDEKEYRVSTEDIYEITE